MVRPEAREWFHAGCPTSMRSVSSCTPFRGHPSSVPPLQGGILKPPAERVVGDFLRLPMIKRKVSMESQAEVRESHEQLSAAWSLYARCSGAGEVVDLDGLRVANARQPWFLINAALPTE